MTPDLDEVEAFLGLISYEDWVAQGEAPPGGGAVSRSPTIPPVAPGTGLYGTLLQSTWFW